MWVAWLGWHGNRMHTLTVLLRRTGRRSGDCDTLHSHVL